MPIWTATLVPLLWLWCMGVYKAGQTVLGSHIGHTAPRLKRRLLGLVLFVLACAVWLLPVLTQQVALPLVGLAGAPSLVTAVFVIFSGVGLALVCFVALSALLWLVIALWLMVRPTQCPYCGQRQGRKPTVGQLCGRCGCSLAAWVYFDDGQGHHRALEAPGQ